MNGPRKLQSQQQAAEQQLQAGQQQQQQQQSGPLEFASPELLLRHDALHTPVPPSIARRLEGTLSQLPPPLRPWWRRLFGK